MDIQVLIHNIRSAHNVGSFFRTCDGAGVSQLILSGYTPAPIDRFGRKRIDIGKTSLGASESVPYCVIPQVTQYLHEAKQAGYTIIAVEQTRKALPYTAVTYPAKTLFIFGNETDGIDTELLQESDMHIMIPMYGRKESLNVAVCGGIILFHARAQSH
jgi:23S rRNA (guanosine2251-2'-O)-methyltransferase